MIFTPYHRGGLSLEDVIALPNSYSTIMGVGGGEGSLSTLAREYFLQGQELWIYKEALCLVIWVLSAVYLLHTPASNKVGKGNHVG